MKLIRTYGKTAAQAEKILRQIEGRSDAATGRLEPAVKRILADIRRKGDDALRRYAERLDGLAPSAEVRVTEAEMKAAWEQTPGELRKSMQAAAGNIRRFARWQMPKEWTRKLRGVQLGQRALPLESVGCYVPGGRYPLPSTLLMTVIPAQVAGRETYRRCFTASGTRNSGGRPLGRGQGVVSYRRCAGDCCARLRDRQRAACR